MPEKDYRSLREEEGTLMDDGSRVSSPGFGGLADYASTTLPMETISMEWGLDNRTDGGGNATQETFYHFYRTEQLTFICVLFAFIIIGNTSVLVTIFISKSRKSRMNFFIMQLAIADLVTGMITVLTDIIWKVTVEWHAGSVGCKLVRYLQGVATFASTYVLVAMSMDRLDAIARPMNFSGSGKRARILVSLAWGFAMAFSTPMLLLNQEKKVKGIKQCWITMQPWHWKLYVSLLAIMLFIIPAIIIGGCYTVIVIVIWRKGSMRGTAKTTVQSHRFNKNKGNGRSSAIQDGRSASQENMTQKKKGTESKASSRGVIPKAKIKTIKMTLVIGLVFIFCWSPFFVFDLLDVYGMIPMSQRKVAIAIFINSLAPLNSAANPVIYCIFSSNIGANLRRLPLVVWLTQKCCRCCGVEPNCPQSANDSLNMSANGNTTYTTGAHSGLGTSCTVRSGSARTSRTSSGNHGTPYVMVTLRQDEKDLLVKHCSKSSTSGASSQLVVSAELTSDSHISRV